MHSTFEPKQFCEGFAAKTPILWKSRRSLTAAALFIALDGPTVIIETVNTAATMRAKDGTVIADVDLSTLFPLATATSFVRQPNVLYDDNSQRFFIIALEADNSSLSFFMHIAVSNTSTPTN